MPQSADTSSIAGGAENDSVSFTGDLSGGYVFGGADEDTLNFWPGLTTVQSSAAMLDRPDAVLTPLLPLRSSVAQVETA